jgi:uncharacterized membrane protein YphA (DoxX/SURF4 family)
MDPRTMLRLGYGLVPIVAGADKFTNRLTDWEQYLSPALERALPVRPRTLMKLVGLVEIAAGLTVLSPLRKTGAWLVSGWLAAITVNLLTTGKYFDIAARDALLAVGALALGRLQEQPQRRAELPAEPARMRTEFATAPAVH